MTATSQCSPALTRPARGQQLHLERTDIWFHTVAPDRVGINVTVRNRSDQPSRPTPLVLQAAPLGAFLSWKPLTVLAVPALAPGESIDLSTEVSRPQPAPLGNFEDVPPRRLLAAVSPEDRPPQAAGGVRSLLRKPSGLRAWRRAALSGSAGPASLPADPLELLGRRNPHWAGNLNVFIGHKAVERHLARALRIYPGRTNLAIFFVGTGPDAYAFELKGDGAAWDAKLYDHTFSPRMLIDRKADSAIEQSTWIETRGSHMMLLAISPPEDCQRGTLEVHVTQRSTGKTAVVEFSLDPAAEGPGCYVV